MSQVIAGIDPGIGITGYGVISVENRMQRHMAHGIIETKRGTPHSMRLRELKAGVEGVLLKYHPDVVAVEELFIQKNMKTALTVGEARGVILVTLQEGGYVIREFTPLQVKQALTGYGRATKQQVQKMVQKVLKMPEIPHPDDAADALAVAICSAQTKISL